MIEVEGKVHKTIEEAAADLRVHPKTLRGYIDKGIVVAPPVIATGLVDRRYFPEELLRDYKTQIKAYREARKNDK
jgi:DNA-binding transcriptional MerR regulator